MVFCHIRPEVPGGLGDRAVLDYSIAPPRVLHMHVLVDGWSGDDLLAVARNYLVTHPLQNAIEIEGLTGVTFASADIEISEQCAMFFPDVVLPELRWMQVTGTPRVDDFGYVPLIGLAVSERGLNVLRRFHLSHATITMLAN